LEVHFDASESEGGAGEELAYEWDLDDDGQFDDSTEVAPIRTYASAGTVDARVRVTGQTSGLTDVDGVLLTPGDTAPTAEIEAPTPATQWATGEPLHYAGTATDEQEGALGPGALHWVVDLNHCIQGGGCHVHRVGTFTGLRSFDLPAPDHYYPAHLTVTLTATDAAGITSEPTTLVLDPRTVDLAVDSSPPGMTLDVNGFVDRAPFTVTAIEGSSGSVAAPSPQTVAGTSYSWARWSDGGDRVHSLTTDAPQSLIAEFTSGDTPPNPPPPPTSEPVTLEVLKLRKPGHAGRLADKGVRALVRCSAACDLEVQLRTRHRRHGGLSGKLGGRRVALGAGSGKWVRVRPGDRAARYLRAHPRQRTGWIVPRFDVRAR
jgi:hypothetical protein